MLFDKLKSYIYGLLDREVIASKANQLLLNDAFVIACESVQERILGDIMTSKPEDAGKRERLYLQYQTVDEIIFELNRLVNNQLDQSVNPKSDQGGN